MANDRAQAVQDGEERETGRIEAFSDGVFAIAITLLVLNLRVPLPSELGPRGLAATLAGDWPAYLAYLTSFVTILIMWINHHALFRLISRTDHLFLLWNGFLLLAITTVPFPTALVAQYLQQPDRKFSTVIYSANMLLIAIAFNLVWRYASRADRLLSSKASRAAIQSIDDSYRYGPLWYACALALAFLNAWASIALNLALALYFALPKRGRDDRPPTGVGM